MKGMWEYLQFISSRAHPGGDGHQDRGGLGAQGCTLAGPGATRLEGHILSGSFIPCLPCHPPPVALHPEDVQACPAGVSHPCICGIIPATPCLKRYLWLTEMLINDSAGRWDSGGPSSHSPGALFELRAELQAHIQHPEALSPPQLLPLLQG